MPEKDRVEKDESKTPAAEDNLGESEPGKRDLDYGNAFGTQRDRSKGGPTKSFDNYSDDWQDAVPDRDTPEDETGE